MKKTLYLMIASAAAVLSAPAIAAVDIAPASHVYSETSEQASDGSQTIFEDTQNYGKRRSFRRGFRSRSHRGFGRHHGIHAKKKNFRRYNRLRHDRLHDDRFHHDNTLRHNNQHIQHDEHHRENHFKNDHRDHHRGVKGKFKRKHRGF